MNLGEAFHSVSVPDSTEFSSFGLVQCDLSAGLRLQQVGSRGSLTGGLGVVVEVVGVVVVVVALVVVVVVVEVVVVGTGIVEFINER